MFNVDLSDNPKAQKKWIVWTMNQVLLYPWKLKITRKRRRWKS